MDDNQICRFCLDIALSKTDPLISPCSCKGSIKYVHLKCLFRWMYGNRLQAPQEECNMCKAVYTYSIETLEETFTPINLTFYHATSTPISALAAAPVLLFSSVFAHPSEVLIGFHSFTAVIYVFTLYTNIKHPIRYIYYYFKDWSIHALALITVFTILNRNTSIHILTFYHFLACCVWYTTQKVDRHIRSSINNRIYKELLFS